MRPLCSKVNMSDKQEVTVAKGERSVRPWQCRKGAQQQQLQLRLANLPQNLYNLNFPRVLLLLLPFFFFREYCSYGCWTVRVDLRATTMPLYRRLDFLNFTCFDNEAGMNCSEFGQQPSRTQGRELKEDGLILRFIHPKDGIILLTSFMQN